MTNKMVNGLLWGFSRGLGNTASKRATEYLGGKVINPKSKFRKRIEKFDLGGDFNSAKKKLMVLIENFHEEYVINGSDLPIMQLGTYLQGDINIIENKLRIFENYITNPENQQVQYEIVLNFWKSVKSSL
jgi:hypothetical protein